MAGKNEPKMRFVDIPELQETFADSVPSFHLSNESLRLTFTVTRLDEPKAGQPPSGKRYPVCRLVLSQAGMLDLLNKMNQIHAVLTQQGIIQREETPPQTMQ